jgi:phage-related tail protein
LHDSSLIGTEEKQTVVAKQDDTEETAPLTHSGTAHEFESQSHDLSAGDYGGRSTDTMSPADKQYEDSFNQGGEGVAKSGTVNMGVNQPRKDVIPDSHTRFGALNYPKHIYDDEW